jgi:hypothetical protein
VTSGELLIVDLDLEVSLGRGRERLEGKISLEAERYSRGRDQRLGM